MKVALFVSRVLHNNVYRNSFQICCRKIHSVKNSQENVFEPVYKLEAIKYISLFNRLKIYHSIGAGLAVPMSGALEVLDILPSNSFVIAAYLGVTGLALFSLGSLITKNIVGFLYITEDDKLIKISIVDYWGKRRDYIMALDEWIPLEELPRMSTKAIYYSPQLQDGTKLKLFFSQGKILKKEKVHLI